MAHSAYFHDVGRQNDSPVPDDTPELPQQQQCVVSEQSHVMEQRPIVITQPKQVPVRFLPRSYPSPVARATNQSKQILLLPSADDTRKDGKELMLMKATQVVAQGTAQKKGVRVFFMKSDGKVLTPINQQIIAPIPAPAPPPSQQLPLHPPQTVGGGGGEKEALDETSVQKSLSPGLFPSGSMCHK